MNTRIIEASALKFPNGAIIWSRCLFDSLMLKKCTSRGWSKDDIYRAKQGFLDQNKIFLTKQEALQVAVASGQFRLKVGSRKTMLNAGDIFKCI